MKKSICRMVTLLVLVALFGFCCFVLFGLCFERENRTVILKEFCSVFECSKGFCKELLVCSMHMYSHSTTVTFGSSECEKGARECTALA